MKRAKFLSIFLALAMLVSLFGMVVPTMAKSPGQDGNKTSAPTVTTKDATDVTTNSATLNGELTDLGTATSVNVSFVWGTDPALYPNETTAETMNAAGKFSAALSGLTPGETYYFRAKAVGDGTSYGDEKSFTTVIPSIKINEFLPNPEGADDASMPGGEWVELYNTGNTGINIDGWVLYDSYDTHELYITSGNTNTDDTIVPPTGWLVVYRNEDSDFSLNNSGNEEVRLYNGYPVDESNLIDETSYTGSTEGKSWARIPDGTGDWQAECVPTPGESNIKVPAVATDDATNITQNSATLNAELTDLGTVTSVNVSFVWGTTSDTTPPYEYTNETTPETMTTTDSFDASLSGLTPGETYYFRAKAVGDGTSYGDEKSFTTTTVPSVKINEFVSNPGTIQGSEWIELHNLGATDIDLTGWTMEDNTGSTYGGGGGDTPLDGKSVPVGGYLVLKETDLNFILNNGGDVIILKSGTTEVDRVEYGDGADIGGPTEDNAPVPGKDESAGRYPNGTDTDVDSADFRIFTTPTPGATNTLPPTVTTKDATDVTTNSATLNGELTDLGTATSVNVSFVWGTTSDTTPPYEYTNETTPETMTTTDSFDASLSGLTPDETYYFRAKAVGDGTSYGDEKSFTTEAAPPVLSTVEVKPSSSPEKPLEFFFGKKQHFKALGKDQYGNVMTNVAFSWSVTNSDAGTIEADTGKFTAGNIPGNYPNVIKATGTKDGVTKKGFASVKVLKTKEVSVSAGGKLDDLPPVELKVQGKKHAEVSFTGSEAAGAGGGKVKVAKYTKEPPMPKVFEETTDTSPVKFVDVNVTGFTQGTGTIKVHYTPAEVAGLDETTLRLYYWDGSTWKLAEPSSVDTVKNIVWGDVLVAALTKTPVGAGGSPLVVEEEDTTPPSAVTDLEIIKVTFNSVTLSWTVPGANPEKYDIRYSTSPIESLSDFFNAAKASDIPEPKSVGETQEFTITRLSADTTYWFALRTADEERNWSDLSNVVMETPSYGQELARKYSPIFFRHSDEPYDPEPVHILIDQPFTFIRDKNYDLWSVGDEGYWLYKFREDEDTHYYIDIIKAGWLWKSPHPTEQDQDDDYLPIYNEVKDEFKPTIYARVVSKEGKTAVQYWTFYLVSDSSLSNENDPRHEGDWELIQLVFDEEDVQKILKNETLTPSSVIYRQHGTCSMKSWDEVEKENGRPVVYVALGSHASYFESGIHEVETEAGKLVDETEKGKKIDNAIVKLLPELSEVAKDSPYYWLTFRGLWGEWIKDQPEYSGTSGPAFQEPWQKPLSWWKKPKPGE